MSDTKRYQKYACSKKGKARSKRYKARNKDKVSAQNQAFYVYAGPHQCCIKECSDAGQRHHPNYKEGKEIIWLCRKHHLMIHGKVRGVCSICGKPHHAKGLCAKHYAKKYRKKQGW